jgi:hypothetical protein
VGHLGFDHLDQQCLRSSVMTLSNSNLSRSYVRPIASKGQLPLRVATAILITAAAALLLIHAGAWGGAPSADLDLLPYLY